jgi:hypothetical protein
VNVRGAAFVMCLMLASVFGTSAPVLAVDAAPSECGVVEFVPAAAPQLVGNTTEERIKATVTFSDGHRESAIFPYRWIYPNGEVTDPWSNTNLRHADFLVTMQLPPPGTDTSAYPPLIRYVLAHTNASGYTILKDCPNQAVGRPPAAAASDAGQRGACGAVAFYAVRAPVLAGRTIEETLAVLVHFADGHDETATWPYPWTYRDGDQNDPWSGTNQRGRSVPFPGVQTAPRGADTSTYPPLVRFVLAHTDRNGKTNLPYCPPYGTPTRYPDPTGITFIDDAPRDSPVEIDDPRLYTIGCLGFRNRTMQTLTVVHFTLTNVDAAGREQKAEHIDRFGSFAPGVLIAGYPRGMSWGRTSNNMLRNCRWNYPWEPEFRVVRIGVTGATFADGTTWSPR